MPLIHGASDSDSAALPSATTETCRGFTRHVLGECVLFTGRLKQRGQDTSFRVQKPREVMKGYSSPKPVRLARRNGAIAAHV